MKPETSNIQLVTTEVKQLIAQSRQHVAMAVNASMSLLYLQIGQRINQEALQDIRAEYGNHLASSISKQLIAEYGD